MNVRFEKSTEEIYRLLVEGLQRFFSSLNTKKATLGLSGGLDSAVVLALAVDALGAKNIKALLMPSEYSTVHSITDAVQMADILNVDYDIIEITPIFKEFNRSLSPVFKGKEHDVAEENLQARIRGTLLMALSNTCGHILLNTSNKSELSVGYGTLYGDLCGAVSVLGDVYKTQAYDLARFINRNKELIPVNIITKAPSAELRHDQKDSDSLPEYEELDAILFMLNEQGLSEEEIINNGIDKKLVGRVSALTKSNKFKALQCPPIIKASSKPLVAEYKWV
ncbi:MAG: NAD(+) synthase [Prevotellaceae bacterium]|jgi:NAD+ synthase (glutamine-hydrolysing)|nr:NAD(+) synthase [Prevotellaceae bacterium]